MDKQKFKQYLRDKEARKQNPEIPGFKRFSSPVESDGLHKIVVVILFTIFVVAISIL